MKLYKITFALLLGVGALTACDSKLDVENPNQQTSDTFGKSTSELEEVVIAAYNHIRMEGTYARVGYCIDVCRGDEAWNCSQVWYLPFDDLNDPITDDIAQWSWRDWYYTINVCNYITKRCENLNYVDGTDPAMDYIKGQALFIRGLAYYNLVNYYQNPPLITDYDVYTNLEKQYVSNVPDPEYDKDGNKIYQYDIVLDQVEADLTEALALLPSKDKGGEWAKGRANKGAAAGFLARALMQRHKYYDTDDNGNFGALHYLKAIINQEYGTYSLTENFGDNFREGTAYENNDESIFEIQFLDKDSQGTDDEWTPVNTSKNATQGSAVESNFAPKDKGGWADIAASPWLYNLYNPSDATEADRTTENNSLDPRLYWTLGTYEPLWNNKPDNTLGNVCYTKTMGASGQIVNTTYAGIPIAKWTHLRTGEYTTVVTGLHDGINLRLMRYSDVLLRAAECENEIHNGPTEDAIKWVNLVRERAKLHKLKLSKFGISGANACDEFFEYLANVERPKEFGCEYGRGNDLIRWGFFYQDDRLKQLKEHGCFRKDYTNATDAMHTELKTPVSYSQVDGMTYKSSFDTYVQGHEFLPIIQTTLDNNHNLVGNSANNSTTNITYHKWTIHPVVTLQPMSFYY